QHLATAVSAAAAAAFCLSHHAAEAFFAPACPASPGGWAARRPPPPPSRSSVATASATTAASTEDEVQRRHFYGYGDPDHVPSILQNITAQRYIDVAEAKARVSETELRKQMDDFAARNGGPIDLFYRITSEEPEMAIAAEFKRASPSKGDIAMGLRAGEQGYLYASVGAAVLSVLTEPKWFKGSLADMKEVRIATNKMREGKAEKRYTPS
ncbi:unnamed protein product, partial [Ectocarpus sp. 8 AP-2014]